MLLGNGCLRRCVLGLRAGVGLVLIAALGCGSESDLHYYGRVRVAKGDYRVLSLHADAEDEYAFARDRSHADDLVLLPFHGKPCRIGKAAGYAVLQRERGLRIAVVDSNDAATLSVFDEQCKSQIDPVAKVSDLAFIDDQLLVTADGDHLYAIDPWHGTQRTISTALTQRGSFVLTSEIGRAIWLLEGDTLVLRDFSGKALNPRPIKHVTEIAVARDQQSMIFSDDRGLYSLDGMPPKRLGEPGCKLHYEPWLSAKTSMNMAMLLSPCEKGRLTLVDPLGMAKVVSDDVTSYFVRHYLTQERTVENWTMFVTQAGGDEAAPKQYEMAPPEGDVIDVDVPISSRSTLFPVQLSHGVAPIWLITTAESEPRFGKFTVKGSRFEEIAKQTQTVALSPAGFVVLHDFTKEMGGTVSLVDLDGQLHALAHAVPAQGLLKWGSSKEPGAVAGVNGLSSVDAVLYDVDPAVGTGTLAKIEPSGRLHRIADGVPSWSPDSYVTLVRGAQLVAAARDVVVLTYLHDFDAKTNTGTLSLVSPDGEQIAIDENVASYVPSDQPGREGVLYATSGHGPHEVWFVRQ